MVGGALILTRIFWSLPSGSGRGPVVRGAVLGRGAGEGVGAGPDGGVVGVALAAARGRADVEGGVLGRADGDGVVEFDGLGAGDGTPAGFSRRSFFFGVSVSFATIGREYAEPWVTLCTDRPASSSVAVSEPIASANTAQDTMVTLFQR